MSSAHSIKFGKTLIKDYSKKQNKKFKTKISPKFKSLNQNWKKFEQKSEAWKNLPIYSDKDIDKEKNFKSIPKKKVEAVISSIKFSLSGKEIKKQKNYLVKFFPN